MPQALWKKALGIPRLSTEQKAREWLIEKLKVLFVEFKQHEPDFEQWKTTRLWARFYELAEKKVRAQYPELFNDLKLF
jgi:hypothetical protein